MNISNYVKYYGSNYVNRLYTSSQVFKLETIAIILVQ